MNLIASPLFEEIKNNLLSITTFLVCVVWLCQRNGWIESIRYWYTEKTNDEHKIVVPALATLVLPFIAPKIFRLIHPLWHQEGSYLVPSMTTLLTFVLAQYFFERRELIKTEATAQKTKKQVVSCIYQDFSIFQKFYRANKLNTPNHFVIERQAQYRPESLRTYTDNIKNITRDFASLVVEIDLFTDLYSLARCLDVSNEVVRDRQAVIEEDRKVSINKSDVDSGITESCKIRLRPLHAKLHDLHRHMDKLNRTIDSKLRRLHENGLLPQYLAEDERLPF